ncbi:FeoA family protein [Teredinibacter franksiae]|jgi:Fe2+ transport system protein A|uniref:FeoA family protein n=1 Tax=Teredinibacter franksiae TaxID=2761453 RepID=UPI0016233121|nr:FeoA family protein [Teredinibacter franksiae]
MSTTLNDLAVGAFATIHSLLGDNQALHRQCGSLGIKPGENLQVLHKSRGKGPMQIKCRGTLFSIRPYEASLIQVTTNA